MQHYQNMTTLKVRKSSPLTTLANIYRPFGLSIVRFVLLIIILLLLPYFYYDSGLQFLSLSEIIHIKLPLGVLFLNIIGTNNVLPQRKMEKWHPCYSSQKEPKP